MKRRSVKWVTVLLSALPGFISAQTLQYDVLLNEEKSTLDVMATYNGSPASLDTSKWNDSTFGIFTYDQALPKPTQVAMQDNSVVFSYTVPLPVRKDLNSPDITLDSNVLSAWGWHLFAIPHLKNGVKAISVNFRFPPGWQWISSLGNGGPIKLKGFKELLAMAVTAGSIKTYELKAGSHKLRLGLDTRSNINSANYIDTISMIVKGIDRALGDKQISKNIFFAVRMLNGKSTFAPGNHENTLDQSNTILFNGNNDNGANPGFWATYAHELLHTVNPGRLKNYTTYSSKFGDWFSEGFTNVLAYKILLREKIITQEQFLTRLMDYAREYEYVTDQKMEANYAAYSKGMLLGFMMDLEMIRHSGGKKDFLTFFTGLINKSDDLSANWNTLLEEAGGTGLVSLYNTWSNAEKLPWMTVLEEAGLKITKKSKYRFLAEAAPATGQQKIVIQLFLK